MTLKMPIRFADTIFSQNDPYRIGRYETDTTDTNRR